MTIKEIHIVSNTHWDREFRFSFQQTRMMLVKMMDLLLDFLEKDKEYASYTLDSHSILVEDYLEIRPENKERIKKLVKEKRLFIGPWYTLPDVPNIGPESVVRNLLIGDKVSSSLGKTMKVGYTPCSWGQISQLPQIYSQFGIDSALFYRGISPHETTTEFIWESPDGTQILGHRFALFARYNYYYLVFRKITYGLDYNDRAWFWGDDGEAPFKIAHTPDSEISGVELLEPKVLYKKENLASALKTMLDIEAPHYAGSVFLAMHGHDISVPHPLETTVNKDSQNLLEGVKVIHSDLEKYIKSVKKNLDYSKIPTLKGERRSNLKNGLWTYLLPATLSARTPLKALDTKTENLLTKIAEPMSLFCSIFCKEEYHAPYLDLAWKYFLSNHTHDANAGCAPDKVINDVLYRIRQASEIASGIVDESLKAMAKNIDTSKISDKDIMILIYNPLPYSRREIADLVIDLPADIKAQSLKIKDTDGRQIECIIKKVEDAGCFVDNIWNVPQTYLSRRYHIKIDTGLLPPVGFKCFIVEPVETPNRRFDTLVSAPNQMENEYLKININSNGTFDLFDKISQKNYENLGGFIEQGEAGNAWRHQAPVEDVQINSLSCLAKILKIEDTPLSASFRIDIVLNLPDECEGELRRSSRLVQSPISQFITLKKGSRRVEIKTQINNTVKDHWLRMTFPVDVKTETSLADSHFDVIRRNIALPDCSDWRETAVGTYPLNSFVSLSDETGGLALLVEGLKEFEILRNKTPEIAISMVRGVRIKLEVAENRKQEIPDVGSQCPGILEFKTALMPLLKEWTPADVITEAMRSFNPVKAAQFGKNISGSLPWDTSLISLKNNSLIITAIKKAENNKNIILRMYNPHEKEASEKITFSFPVKKIWVSNLNEKRLEPISQASFKTLVIKAKAKKILTFEIEPEKKK